MTMGYNPKPTRDHRMKKYKSLKRNQKWLNRMGKRFYDWESFKQSVVFPWFWLKHQGPLSPLLFNVFAPGEQMHRCAHPKCEVTGRLTLLERPDQYGRMWLSELQVDHILPRTPFPEKVFLLSNFQFLCDLHNRQKGSFYSRPPAEGIGTNDKAPID